MGYDGAAAATVVGVSAYLTTAGLPICPNRTIWRASCKRRSCEVCGVRWARDWHRVMSENLSAYNGPVILVSVTAPGADRLPWDEDRCRRKHRHSGPAGCRVQQRAAREWAELCTLNWGMLRRAAAVFARRHAGVPVTLLERVWEPQKRGVPHLHLVLGVKTAAEREAARAFVGHLATLAPEYDFGYVDRRALERPMKGEEAARYLASYLTGRTSKKGSIRENIADPVMPRSLVWLTPRLTRTTFVTMRSLRRARHLWAHLEGIAEDGPRWVDYYEKVRVLTAYATIYCKRGPPTIEIDGHNILRFVEAGEGLRRRGYLPPVWELAAA